MPKNVSCDICGWRGYKYRHFLERYFIIPNQQCPVCGSLNRNRGMIDYFLKLGLPEKSSLIVEEGVFWANRLAIEPRFKYVAIDLEPRRDPSQRPAMTVAAKAEALPLPNNCADVIISSHMLEHVEDDKKALSEFKRVLKRDGHLLLDVPFDENVKTYPLDKPDHIGTRRQYGNDVQSLVESFGFNVVKKYYFNCPNPTQEETFFHARPI